MIPLTSPTKDRCVMPGETSTPADKPEQFVVNRYLAPVGIQPAAGASAIHIGTGAVGDGDASIAMGYYATTSAAADSGIALGDQAVTSGLAGVSIGRGAYAKSKNGVAIGGGALSSGTVARLNGAQAIGVNAIAIGGDLTGGSVASATSSLAIGAKATSTATNATSLGATAKATGGHSTALGSGSVANGAKSVSVGHLNVSNGDNSLALGESNSTSTGAKSAIAIGTSNKIEGTSTYASAIGLNNTVKGNAVRVVGNTNNVTSDFSGVFGSSNTLSSTATGANVVGLQNTVAGAATNVVGNWSKASGNYSMVLGDSGEASASNAIAIGTNAKASVANSVALGNGATTEAVVGTTQATIAGKSYSFAGAAPTGTLSLGSAATTDSGGNAVASVERTITHVAAGRLAVTSTDAVNGSQLNATNQALGELSEGVQALGDLSDGVVVYDRGTGGTLNEGNITLAGDAGTRITNLTDATLSTDSTDAVTGRQLNATNVRVTQNEGDIANLTTNLGDIAADSIYYQANSSASGASASGTDSLAMGPAAVSSATNAVSIGNGASSSVFGGVALGSGAIANREVAKVSGQIVVGNATIQYNTSDADLIGAVSVGQDGEYRQLINIADGIEDHDAVTMRQLKGAVGSLSDTGSLYFHANGGGEVDALATGEGSIAIGPDTTVNGDDAIGMGVSAKVEIGAAGAVAIGDQSHTLLEDAIAVGSTAVSSGEQAMALGAGASANQAMDVALGAQSTSQEAIGTESGIIFGEQHEYAGTNPIATVSVGDEGQERTLTHLAAGRISATSTDAVNGSQLHATNMALEEVVAYDHFNDGSVDWNHVTLKSPGRAFGGTVLGNIADGSLSDTSLEAVNGSQLHATNGRLTNLEGDVGDIQTTLDSLGGGSGNPAQNVVQYDPDSNQGKITLAGADGGTVISNLAEGDIHQGSTDAVNGGQIWDLMEDIGDLALSGQDTKYFQANSQGDAATTSAADTVAIGGGAKAQAEGGVALGDGAVADREGMKGEEEAFSHVAVESSKGAVAVGNEGGERQITHVAGGTEDTDAVNVRQLGAVQEGAVNYDRSEDGSVDYHSVSLGNGSGPTQLHNVAAGSAPTDAVNMSQLNELNRKFTSDYNQLDHKIDEVERDASAGIAALAAMGDAPYVAGKLTYHVGTGYYNGESALGVSVRRTADTGRWSVGMGIGASHGGPTVGLGISGVID